MDSKKNNFINKIKAKVANMKVKRLQKKAAKNNVPKVSFSTKMKSKFANLKNFSWSNFINYIFNSKRFKTNTLSLLVIVIFLVTTINVLTMILGLIGGHQSTRYYIEDNIKYLEIENGYITEKLIVESGDELPNISDYFSEDYEIREDATISYYSGKDGISIESFTYEKDDIKYVRGFQEIDVIINNGKEYTTKLEIRDTTEPYVILQDLTISEGESIEAKSFVSLYNDNSQITEYNAYYPDSINFSVAGVYDVKIKVCDYSNNCVEGISKLTVTKGSNDSNIVSNDNKNETTSSGGKKPGNSSSSKPSGGSSSGGGSSSSGSSGNNKPSKPDDDTPARVFVKTVVEKNAIYKFDDYYGARMNYYAREVTYNLYSDGYKEVVNYKTPYDSVYDSSGYVGNIDGLNNEATQYISTHSSALSSVQNLFLEETNKQREKANVSNLSLDKNLSKIALIRAMELAYSQSPGTNGTQHIRPDGRRFDTIYTEYGYKTNTRGENFVDGIYSISNYTAFQSFVKSSGHLKNMTNPVFKKMGVGKFTFQQRTYWVQLFAE